MTKARKEKVAIITNITMLWENKNEDSEDNNKKTDYCHDHENCGPNQKKQYQKRDDSDDQYSIKTLL